MSVLDSVDSPTDLRELTVAQMQALAADIREFLIAKVSATGGHLGPNLGVVETTLAIHRVFDSPNDAVLFDTGHQSYVHKIVTGRKDRFDTLRQRGGLTGYQERAESEHDWIESSHASAALSYADGLAKAFELSKQDRHVVAVVGDGALTGGMCWEALNNIAAGDRPVVIVVNDNGRSYAPTIGGFARHLSGLRLQPGYERVLDESRRAVLKLPLLGQIAYAALHGLKTGIKDALAPQAMFTDLGIKYVGPVDGHDQEALENALRQAKSFGGSVIVHTVTSKGMGYHHAENHVADRMHATGIIDPETGKSTSVSAPDWTSVFSAALVEAGSNREDIVAITAAMPGPTGLSRVRRTLPGPDVRRRYRRAACADLGRGSCSGRSASGGRDLLDLPQPGLRPAADGRRTAEAAGDVGARPGRGHRTRRSEPQRHVGSVADVDRAGHAGGRAARLGTSARRIRRGARDRRRTHRTAVPERCCPGGYPGSGTTCRRHRCAAPARPRRDRDVLIVAVGPFASLALDTAARLAQQGIGATVVDPRWVLPVPESIVDLAQAHRLVVTVEDGGVHGGVGSSVSEKLRAESISTPVRDVGIEQRFLSHASRGQLLDELGLTAQDVARAITAMVSSMQAPLSSADEEDLNDIS